MCQWRPSGFERRVGLYVDTNISEGHTVVLSEAKTLVSTRKALLPASPKSTDKLKLPFNTM